MSWTMRSKPHDAEEYGRIAGAMRALLARHDEKR